MLHASSPSSLSPDPTTLPAAGRRRRRLARPGRRALLATLGLIPVLVIGGVFASPFIVQHSSMVTTLEPGAVLLVDRVSPELNGIQRGEVVVFRPPIAGYTGEPFVKRVIGLPGEHVSIRAGHVYINGQELAEPYVYDGELTTTSVADYELTVPAGDVFVLGDHRADSYDSRGYGPVPISSILGRAWLALEPGASPALLSSPAYPSVVG